MTIKCKSYTILSPQKEIKDEMNLSDEKCEFNASKKLSRVEIKKGSEEKVKTSVLDLYHIGKACIKAKQKARFEEEVRKMLLENGITY